MTLFAAAPFMGPVLGPIISGFLGESRGGGGYKACLLSSLALYGFSPLSSSQKLTHRSFFTNERRNSQN